MIVQAPETKFEIQQVSLSDISKTGPNYRQQAKEYFAEQAKKCDLLAEKMTPVTPGNAASDVEPISKPTPPTEAPKKEHQNDAESSNGATDQTTAPKPVAIAKVDATLDRSTGKLTISEMDGNAQHKKGDSITVEAQSGNGECSIPHGQGADGRYDNEVGRGPIPKGDYLIGKMYKNKHIAEEYPTGDAMWYRLYGSDGKGGYDYNKMWNDRGVFNLHTGDRSDGCVGIPSDVKEPNPGYPHSKNFDKVKNFINSSKPFEYKPGDEMQGWLHVK